jgi:hypothetical protein
MSLEIKVKLANCRSKLQISELANEIHSNQKLLSEYYKLTSEKGYEDADKAAWIIRCYFQKLKSIDLKNQKKVIQLLSKVNNQAVLRNLSGVMADIPFDKKHSEDVINLSFKILNEDFHDVAVYANFMIALIPFIRIFPELKAEIEHMAERNPMKDKCAFQLRLKTVLSLKTE